MRKYQFTEQTEIIQRCIRLYDGGLKTQEIATMIGKSRASVCYYLKHSGISTRKGQTRKYEVDNNFFSVIDSPNKAYWLGFLLADGHLGKNYVRIEVSSRDSSHLSKFNADLLSNAPIKSAVHKRKGYETEYHSNHVSLCSVDIQNDLERLGFRDYKSHGSTKILDNVPDFLKPDLVRGLFDGDGSFQKSQFSFVDQFEAPVVWFSTYTKSVVGREPTLRRHRNAFEVRFGTTQAMKKFGNHIYASNGTSLIRKRDKFLELTKDTQSNKALEVHD